MAARIVIDEARGGTYEPIFESDSVVGHIVVAVIKREDGELGIERLLGVNAEPEDGPTISAFIEEVNKKIAEALPQEEPQPQIWIPE